MEPQACGNVRKVAPVVEKGDDLAGVEWFMTSLHTGIVHPRT